MATRLTLRTFKHKKRKVSNGILCPSKNVTLACEHVSYLENGFVLMAQIFSIVSFCKYVQFRYHYGFQYSGQRKL